MTKAIGGIIGDLTGASQQANAAQQAAQTQAGAAQYAADKQAQAFQQLQQNLAPYSAVGTAVLPQLLKSLGYTPQFSSPAHGVQPSGVMNQNGMLTGITGNGFTFNPSDLENTPGYQFTLQQANKALNNSFAGRGLNLSGAQAKGLADYTTGLAQNTYNQQYQNALNQYQTNASNLSNLLNLGQNAAAGVGQAGINVAGNIGNLATQGANATAAGQIAGGNTTTNALNSLLGLGQGAAGIYSLGSLAGLFGPSAAGAGAALGAGGAAGAGDLLSLAALA